MDKPTFVYVTYIATTLEQLWEALTSEPFTQQYWEEGQLQSDWQVGSSVQQINPDGESQGIGEVLQSEPPYRLSYTLQPPNVTSSLPSRVRFEMEPYGVTVKLTLIHERLNTQSCIAMSRRWTDSLSYLKRLLEIEEVLALVA
ncbi:MAG: ATPase [Microcoleus sp. SIO2G3]|nr:ATPase [Microcoleus sp. SIO2G3]